MTIFKWHIDSMSTLQEPDPNYVVNVAWTLVGDQDGTTASISGTTIFAANQESNFIPYDELTEEQVIGWVKSDLGESGVHSYEGCVQGQINSILNPPVSPQGTPLPWAA